MNWKYVGGLMAVLGVAAVLFLLSGSAPSSSEDLILVDKKELSSGIVTAKDGRQMNAVCWPLDECTCPGCCTMLPDSLCRTCVQDVCLDNEPPTPPPPPPVQQGGKPVCWPPEDCTCAECCTNLTGTTCQDCVSTICQPGLPLSDCWPHTTCEEKDVCPECCHSFLTSNSTCSSCIADRCANPAPPPPPSDDFPFICYAPGKDCNVCEECCKPEFAPHVDANGVLSNFQCQDCVTHLCEKTKTCWPEPSCEDTTVCSECCAEFLDNDQGACNGCVKSLCHVEPYPEDPPDNLLTQCWPHNHCTVCPQCCDHAHQWTTAAGNEYCYNCVEEECPEKLLYPLPDTPCNPAKCNTTCDVCCQPKFAQTSGMCNACMNNCPDLVCDATNECTSPCDDCCHSFLKDDGNAEGNAPCESCVKANCPLPPVIFPTPSPTPSPSPPPTPSPSPPPTPVQLNVVCDIGDACTAPCAECCHDYLAYTEEYGNQPCVDCVTKECTRPDEQSNICWPRKECTVCQECCTHQNDWSPFPDELNTACDACAEEFCPEPVYHCADPSFQNLCTSPYPECCVDYLSNYPHLCQECIEEAAEEAEKFPCYPLCKGTEADAACPQCCQYYIEDVQSCHECYESCGYRPKPNPH